MSLESKAKDLLKYRSLSGSLDKWPAILQGDHLHKMLYLFYTRFTID